LSYAPPFKSEKLAPSPIMPPVTLDDLRRYAVARSLFAPTTLGRAIDRLGFVQADPIRAPARAQDLMLRLRVKGYRAGDLERRYAKLELDEGFFINYGFLHREVYRRMLPRVSPRAWSGRTQARAEELRAFIAERGVAHPREVDQRFAHGKTINYWGGTSNATTHLLAGMHYRGLLRVVRRERGVRVYAVEAASSEPALEPAAQLDAFVDLLVGTYAPLPRLSLAMLVSRLRFATPQWQPELKAALLRARERLSHARIEGVDWYWPADERPASRRHAATQVVRLLTPFDPVVWDRRRFELLWGWPYRFEAYTPAPARKFGYYALPLLWGDRVVGWSNLGWNTGKLSCDLGFVRARPRERAFSRELEAELARMTDFLDRSMEA
jgi:uncharacterized protein